MEHVRWCHSLLFSVSLATWGLSEPFYVYILEIDAIASMNLRDYISNVMLAI